MMKLNTLFVAALCAGALLTSCDPKTAQENQLKYTHTSLADGDAFQFFEIVGAKAVYEVDYATYAESASASSQTKQLSAKVKEVYGAILPGLDSIAIVNQVDFPVKGAEVFKATPAAADSTGTVTAAFSDEAYVHHVQHEAAIVKEQFTRLTRNTNKGLQDFAKANLEKVTELFTLAGGKEDEHAHH